MLEMIESYFSGINELLAVFIVSMMPIVELRGAIPFGVALGLDWLSVYIVCVIGNIIPVPFIILFFRPIINFLEGTKLFGKLAQKIMNRTTSKARDFSKYKMLGLFAFVAIPLPGTGAWTGSAIAALLKMRLKHAIPTIIAGVCVSGILMMGISYGFGELFSHFFM